VKKERDQAERDVAAAPTHLDDWGKQKPRGGGPERRTAADAADPGMALAEFSSASGLLRSGPGHRPRRPGIRGRTSCATERLPQAPRRVRRLIVVIDGDKVGGFARSPAQADAARRGEPRPGGGEAAAPQQAPQPQAARPADSAGPERPRLQQHQVLNARSDGRRDLHDADAAPARSAVSSAAGALARARLPTSCTGWRCEVRAAYGVDSRRPSAASRLRDLADFFSRRLKPDLRPVTPGRSRRRARRRRRLPDRLRPGGLCVQRRDRVPVASSCRRAAAAASRAARSRRSTCRPGTNHRIHAPLGGRVAATATPGELWP